MVNNFLKSMACYHCFDINICICISLTYPENFQKVYNMQKSYDHLYTKLWVFGENILSVADISQRY